MKTTISLELKMTVEPDKRAKKTHSVQQYFRHLPCGTKVPDSIHAVSVSMPTLRDIIGYEEKHPETLSKIVTGYPRFVTHPYILKIQERLNKEFALKARQILILSSVKAAKALCSFAEIAPNKVIEYKNITGVVLPEDKTKIEKAQAFLQHTGTGISSRWAEDILREEGILPDVQAEEYFGGDAENHILNILKDSYGAASKDNIYLTSSGMNSIYSAYNSISSIQIRNKKSIWIQLGWMFVDTMDILKKLGASETGNYVIYDIYNLEQLEFILKEKGEHISGIITEVPSNPLVQTPDIKRIKGLADKHNCIFVIDATLGTPHNVNVLPYADLIVESLTKYASGYADLMMGAVVLNCQSRFYEELRAVLPNFLEPPYFREIRRLAFQISGYAERIKKINQNTMKLVDFLQSSKCINKIFWAYEEKSRVNFEKIQKNPDSPGGVITVELNKPLDSVYDYLKIAKGPSCGAEFTLIGPYLYLAHYNLVSHQEGRKFLNERGINPELLRISVGTEQIEDIIQTFSEVL
jgi:cystathionine gamma-synthase